MKGAAALFGLALVFATPALADGTCQLERLAQMPMTIDETGRVTVPITISGKPFNMMLDTGAFRSFLSADAAASLGLRLKDFRGLAFGVGGYPITNYVTAHDIKFGELLADRDEFMVQPRELSFGVGVDGLLGEEILETFDYDLDFANSRFSLFSTVTCGDTRVWWTRDGAAEIPYEMTGNHIVVPVTLDGQTFKAILDTGAHYTLMDFDTAKSLFDLDDKDPKIQKKPSEGGFGQDAYVYPFKAFSFGGVTVQNPAIQMQPRSNLRMLGFKMLIGMNVLRTLHIYVRRDKQILYVTPASAH